MGPMPKGTPVCAAWGGGAGCVWLQNCGISAVFFILLHRQVLDLLDYQGGQMKFETRHSPHAFFSY